MNADAPFTFRVIDLKQYVYCPRILYYQTILPEIRPLTYKMEAGQQAHKDEAGREARRSLKKYGLTEGERTFDLPLYSTELGLSGSLDMLIETAVELIPVDYKQSKRIGAHYKLQLMAYGRLLELSHPSGKPVKRGFLYLLPTRKATAVSFTPTLRQQFNHALTELRHIAWSQKMPVPATQTARCVDCEFRRFCNDRPT